MTLKALAEYEYCMMAVRGDPAGNHGCKAARSGSSFGRREFNFLHPRFLPIHQPYLHLTPLLLLANSRAANVTDGSVERGHVYASREYLYRLIKCRKLRFSELPRRPTTTVVDSAGPAP